MVSLKWNILNFSGCDEHAQVWRHFAVVLVAAVDEADHDAELAAHHHDEGLQEEQGQVQREDKPGWFDAVFKDAQENATEGQNADENEIGQKLASELFFTPQLSFLLFFAFSHSIAFGNFFEKIFGCF